tara:strand:+ start:29367 stop:30581 length:1215 start_codon:yes stop_codon:yes gene_type:complete
MVKFNFGLFNFDVKNLLEGNYLTYRDENWNWRYLWFYAIIYVSFSCQENKTKQDSQVNRYSVDTVLIDSKNRILDLRGNLRNLTLDDSRKSFFLLNHFDLSIDEIDLDRHMFVKSYPLEPEGPNGVGDFIRSIQSVNDSLFFIKSNIGSSLIDKSGQIVKRIVWEDARDSNGSELMQFYRDKEVLSGTDYLKVFGENFDLKNGNVFLDVLSVSDNKINRFDIDPENSYHDFIFRWDDNVAPPEVHLSSDKKYIRISHEFSNEIILFNLQGEFVKVVQYEPQKTPKRAKIPSGPEIKARDQAGKDYQRILEQVRFESPVWDSVKKRYLRLSSKKTFTDTFIDESFLPEIKETRVFLSIFDAEFNLISEMQIDELNNERVKYFAKDGKLWVCQNFSDELGFVVIDI